MFASICLFLRVALFSLFFVFCLNFYREIVIKNLFAFSFAFNLFVCIARVRTESTVNHNVHGWLAVCVCMCLHVNSEECENHEIRMKKQIYLILVPFHALCFQLVGEFHLKLKLLVADRVIISISFFFLKRIALPHGHGTLCNVLL